MCKKIMKKIYAVILLTIAFLLLSNLNVFSEKVYATEYQDSNGIWHLDTGDTYVFDDSYKPLYGASYERNQWLGK